MESESESRPLLHSFERETWRSSMRKRCLRIPSEVTITGIILGLFLLVVTLLMVLENLETTNKNELTLDNNLQASSFKYNKKAVGISWQEKKDSMKLKKKSKFEKWDKVDDGWTWKISDPQNISNRVKVTNLNDNRKDQVEITEIPNTIDEYGKEVDDNIDEYGKEVDDNWETFLEKVRSVAYPIKDSNEDEEEAMTSFESSEEKWKEIDDGWKTLSQQGWKDKEIKEELIKAILEKNTLDKQAGILQSPLNLDGIWNEINEGRKKNMGKGDHKQESINNEKNKIQVLQSPKPSDSKWGKVDDGWKKLSDQGWKDKDLKDALIKAILEKNGLLEQVKNLQSPMTLDDKWDNINEGWKKNMAKGEKEQRKQETVNNEWKNKMHVLQSPKASDSKWGKVDDGWKKLFDQGTEKEKFHDDWANVMKVLKSPKISEKTKDDKGWQILSKQGWKDKDIKEAMFDALKEETAILQSPTTFENFLDDVIQSKKEDPEEESSFTVKKNGHGTSDNILQPAMTLNKMDRKKVDNGWKTLLDQGWKDNEIKKALYKAWNENNKRKGSGSMKWKKVKEGWKQISNKS